MQGCPERHFPGWEDFASSFGEHQESVVMRLLEDGHRDDLLFLSRHFQEDRLRTCFRERGGRQLSRRSRAFWAVVLGIEEPSTAPLASDLWPL